MLNDLVYLHKIIENDFGRWVLMFMASRIRIYEQEKNYNTGCKVVYYSGRYMFFLDLSL